MPMQSRSTELRGLAVLRNPALNKGTAFSAAERRDLGLEGLLPDQVESLLLQVERAWSAFEALGDDLERHAFMESLRRSTACWPTTSRQCCRSSTPQQSGR